MADRKDMGLNERDSTNRKGKPVQILSPAEKGYDILEEEIEQIFGHPDIVLTPVAIYSIAGAFRTGKSFMLNFFLRFLWAQEKNESETWLTSQEKELVEGFAWRGGAEKHTPGIWVWNKPFFFNTPQHGKVALFLLDTEGAFDHTKHTNESSIIFGLSTLLSSVQIYNVQNKIQGDTLEHLQLLTDYTKTVKQSPSFLKALQSIYGKAVGKQENREKFFQNLIFLVRDWSNTDYDFNFEGGQKILDKFLQSKSENTKIESVRKNLRESFENISCCLIPHPGFDVSDRAEKQGSKLSLKDVRKEFLETVDILVKELCSSGKMVVKRMNGNLVTGNDFSNFISAYFKIFSSGEMPEIETMLQAAAKAGILQCIDQCKNGYRSEMQKKLQEGSQTEEDLQRNHHDLKSAALLKFDQTPKLGDEEFIERYRKHLEENTEIELQIFQEIVKGSQEQLQSKVTEEANKAVEMYWQHLKENSGGKYVDEKRLREVEQKSRNESMKQFQDETSNLPSELVENYKSTFLKKIDNELKRFEESNTCKLELLKFFLEGLAQKVDDSYKDFMEKKCLENVMSDEEFEEAHQEAWEKAMQIFDQSEIGKNTHERKEKWRKLVDKIKERSVRFKRINERNNMFRKQKVEMSFKEAADCYTMSMTQKLLKGYLEEKLFLEEHKNSEKEARKIIESQKPSIVEKCIPLFSQYIENEKKQMTDCNNALKEKVVNGFRKAKTDAFDKYTTRIDAVTQEYKHANELEILHKTEKEKAVGKYNELDARDLQEIYNSIKQKLEEQINDHYSQVKQQNTLFKIELEGKGSMLLHGNKAAYLISMKKLCDGKYVEPAALRDAHDRCKREAHTIFSSNFKESASDIKDKFVEKFNQDVEKLYKQLKTYNDNNKHIFWRKVKSFLWGTIKGPWEGLVSGAKMGVEVGNKLLGPVGRVAGALLGVPTGVIGGLLTGGASEVEKIGTGFKPS